MPNMDGTGPDGRVPMSGGRNGRCRNLEDGKNNSANSVNSGSGKGNCRTGKGNCSSGWGKHSQNGTGQLTGWVPEILTLNH